MQSLKMRLAAVALAAGLAALGCTRSGPAVPGRLYLLTGTTLTVVERSKSRPVALPSELRLATLSPSGAQVAGILGNRLVLLDTTRSKAAAVPLMDAPQASLIVWSPGGDRLAVAGSRKTLTIVDTKGVKAAVLDGFDGDIKSVHWSPDGQRLAMEVGPANVADITLWMVDVATKQAAIAAKNATSPAWSPDSGSLGFALWDGRPESRLLSRPLTGETKPLISPELLTAVRPDLAELFMKNALHLNWAGWSPKGDAIAVTFKAAGADPRYVALTVSPQGELLAARIFPVYPALQPHMSPPLPCAVGRMTWALNQERLVAPLGNPGCEGKVAILNARTLETLSELPAKRHTATLVSPDGAWVALQNPDGNLEVINLADPSQSITIPVSGELLLWADR